MSESNKSEQCDKCAHKQPEIVYYHCKEFLVRPIQQLLGYPCLFFEREIVEVASRQTWLEEAGE